MSGSTGRAPRRRAAAFLLAGFALSAAGLTAQPAAAPSAPAAPTPAAPPALDGPYRVGGAVTAPKLIHRGVMPAYTEEARQARIMGVVILEAVIDERGRVTEPRVLKPLPHGLDQAAVDAVQTWTFEPATFQGVPVKVYYSLVVHFQLGGGVYQGAAFSAFLAAHPGFAEAFHQKRWDEAGAYLDALPATADPAFARAYLLLNRGRLDEAWQGARGYAGAHRRELLRAVALHALQLALDGGGEATVAVGLAAADLALAAEPDDFEVLLDKSQLLRAQAAQAGDDAARQRLLAEAEALRARAAALRKARPE